MKNGSNVVGPHYTTYFNKVPYSFIDVAHGEEDDGTRKQAGKRTGKWGPNQGSSLGNRAKVEVIQALQAIMKSEPWRGSLTELFFNVLCHHWIHYFVMLSKLLQGGGYFHSKKRESWFLLWRHKSFPHFLTLCVFAGKSKGVEIEVITPYTRQVGDAKQALQSTKLDVEVKSVDGFQGRYERESMEHLFINACV